MHSTQLCTVTLAHSLRLRFAVHNFWWSTEVALGHPSRKMRKAPEVLASGGWRVPAALQMHHKGVGVRSESTVEKPGLRRGGKRERVHDGLRKWITLIGNVTYLARGLGDYTLLAQHIEQVSARGTQIAASTDDWPRTIAMRHMPVQEPFDRAIGTIDHGAIVDNKRLSQVLRTAQIVQAQRDDRVIGRPSTAHRADGTPIPKNKIAGTKRQRDLTVDDLHTAINDTRLRQTQGKEVTC
jgi:hypothetical protein